MILRRGSNQGNTQNEKSLYHQSSIDFRCYLEMALFEPRRFFAPARLFPGGIVTLALSRTGPLVTIHDAGPDLCPTLQEANITLSAAIQAGYQL